MLAVVAASMAACASPGVDILETESDESALSIPKEGTREACAVLNVANQASQQTLDVDVKLDSRAASGIVRFRAGADGTSGTSDDRLFHTVAELDAIPYVGATAFSQILAYAASWGILDGCARAGYPSSDASGSRPDGGSSDAYTRTSDGGSSDAYTRTSDGGSSDAYTRTSDGGIDVAPSLGGDSGVSGLDAVSSTSADLFSSSLDAEPGLDQKSLAALFAAGASTRNLAGFVLGSRTRQCSTVTGCSDWVVTDKPSITGRYQAGTGGWGETPTSSALPTGNVGGTLNLSVKAPSIVLDLRASTGVLYSSGCDLSVPSPKVCKLYTSTTQCYWQSNGQQACFSYQTDVMAPSGASIYLTYRVTTDFVLGRSGVYATKADASGSYAETEFVLYGRVRGAEIPALRVEQNQLLAVW